MAQNIAIRSEEEAFEAIERLLTGVSFKGRIELEGWPKLKVRLVGEKFESSITPSVMRSFIELQNLVYRSYAIARYETDDTRRLSKEERDELEIQVKVEEGSSIFEIDFQDVLIKFAEKAGESMTPELMAVTVLGLGVLWAGKTAYGSYLNYRKEVRLAEVKSEEQRDMLSTMQALSREETQRAQVLNRLLLSQPSLAAVEQQAYDARTEMLKGFATADEATVSGFEVSQDVAKELVTNARRRAVEKRLDGYYRVVRVDSSDPDSFRVKVRRRKSGVEFEAYVENDTLDGEMKETLQYAEWERTTVFLNINAKVLDGDIRQAVILGVTRAEPPS
ncbi:hypothetical protein [Pseudomonas aeruginosa]|uniref:hypothetical protein n=1 Tax=Pseudomonas aeruginosa TaxID=287 RepID=UPI001495E5C2|nr:hypothetical protein [Pseudomonas aeruginosa]NPT01903.1 hypothetical protein [Pseudomonas aeruginosa]HEK0816007.1 hypothetical protein [Pseudomonas aeruginosa]HEK3698370.1 hypothetical protein [Pseudomonas aeruginosa]